MSEGQARRAVRFLSSWIVALVVLVGCDSNFDTSWRKPDAIPDAGEGDAASADAGELDAAQDAAGMDAAEADAGVVPILPLVNCAGFVRDAAVDAAVAVDAGADASPAADATVADAAVVDAAVVDAGVVDAGDGGCEVDCTLACTLLCRDGGCSAEADVWLSCARCLVDGGFPPTL